jgi:hypothetical protein
MNVCRPRKIILLTVLGAALSPNLAGAETVRMVIQSHPDAGSRCVFVPNLQSAKGTRLQMLDCNNTVSQIFTYDDQSQQLKIRDLCVESIGPGDAQDAAGVGTCNGGANQHWRMEAVKDHYQLVGINNRCLEVQGDVNVKGTPLDIQDCDAAAARQLWALVEAPVVPADCQKSLESPFNVPLGQSGSLKWVSVGGGSCLDGVSYRDEVQWTSISIAEQPANGTFGFAFKDNTTPGFLPFQYRPNPGFKGTDEAAVKICGHDNQDHVGCATLTYHITVN